MKSILETLLKKPFRSIMLIDAVTYGVCSIIATVKGDKIGPRVNLMIGTKPTCNCKKESQ